MAEKEPDRFVLGIAYQAGPDPRIKRGMDGGRDWIDKADLERAAWSYMRSGCPRINAFHIDGTEDCAEPVESFIWRWDDWDVGDGIVVKDGDWCLGAILSPRMWDLHKQGKVNGLSPQGTARRLRVQKEGAVTLAKRSVGPLDDPDDDDEFTQIVDANIPTVALVGDGANGIPRFLMSKQEGVVGLLDSDFVRSLIEKSEPATGAPSAGETVTMTGSPAAITALIHGAAVRKAAPAEATFNIPGATTMSDADIDKFARRIGQGLAEQLAPVVTDIPTAVEKAEESAKTQNDLPDSAFAYIEAGGTKDESGRTVPRSKRHFNIHDAAHVRNALARAPQSPFGDKAMPKIRAAAKKFGIDVSKTADFPDTNSEVAKDMAMGMDDEPGDGTDMMDPTTVLAMPEDEAPGDPTDPGSPAWESIDAATARKWTAIAARLRSALGIMSDRESLEAATADPSDAEAAMDLDDAACAVDYVISTLAPFAIDEQAESDEGSMAMEMVGKALTRLDPAHLDTVEALGSVRKAGRALSTANEAALRSAIKALQEILASLPAAPMTKESGQSVAKTANEEPDMPQPAISEDVITASGQAPAMGSAEAAPEPVAVAEMVKAEAAPVDQGAFAELVKQVTAALNSRSAAEPASVAKAEEPATTEPVAITEPAEPVVKAEDAPALAPVAEQPVAKSEKPPQVAIYDAKGNLVGTVDPGEITMLAPAKAPEPAAKADDATPDEPAASAAEAPAAPPTDLAPQPPAAAGVPADAVPPDGAMTKQADPGRPDTPTLDSSAPTVTLTKALADYSATQEQALAAQMAEIRKGMEERGQGLEELVKTLQAQIDQRISALENAPPVYAIASNGAIPDPRFLRGQNHGAAAVDPSIGPMLKARLANSDDATEQKVIADEMTTRANALFQQLQTGGRR